MADAPRVRPLEHDAVVLLRLSARIIVSPKRSLATGLASNAAYIPEDNRCAASPPLLTAPLSDLLPSSPVPEKGRGRDGGGGVRRRPWSTHQ